MKRLRRILTVVAMTFMASVSCYAFYCPGSTQTCPEGYDNCAPVGEIEVDDDDPDNPITPTGDMLCYTTGEGGGEPYYLVLGYLIDASNITQDEIKSLGPLGEQFTNSIVYTKSPLPLTDAILPLTLALGVYGWMIRRRQKKHRG